LTERSRSPRRRGVGIKWYQSLKKSVLGTVEIMPPRIHVVPPIVNYVVGREVRELHARLEAMEVMKRRTSVTGDVSDAESEEIEVEEARGEDAGDERFLKYVMKLGSREKISAQMYEGNLDAEELLD
jgi:hypothetical protein